MKNPNYVPEWKKLVTQKVVEQFIDHMIEKIHKKWYDKCELNLCWKRAPWDDELYRIEYFSWAREEHTTQAEEELCTGDSMTCIRFLMDLYESGEFES